MRKVLRFAPIVVILVVVLEACNGYESALTLTYAFRKAESAALKDPAIGGKITDVNVQRKINALEGEFDTAWNCAYVAYAAAAEKTPEGQKVVVTATDFQPCVSRAWSAAFQLLETVRVFKPDFLSTPTAVTTPDGKTINYTPITSPTIPDGMLLAPSAKLAL